VGLGCPAVTAHPLVSSHDIGRSNVRVFVPVWRPGKEGDIPGERDPPRGRTPTMARAIWSGSINFGLVSIPVKLYGATEPKDVRFHELEAETGKRIHHKRVAGTSNREVPYDDVVKGYEVSKGQYVVVTPEELEAIEPGRGRTIDVEDFVDLAVIDPVCLEKAYYLVPDVDRGGAKPYALLLKALDRTGKVGVGTFVLRTKQHLTAIRPSDGVLALHTMFFADEVRTGADLENVPVRARVSSREVEMAERLIESQSTDWRPAKYKDTYRQRALKLVRDKAKGKEIAVEREAEAAPIRDIMEALRASVEASKRGEKLADVRTRLQRERREPAGRRHRGRKEDLASLPKERLLERARRADISGRSAMSKQELVEALRQAS
jgi:DNA end-binding protein Ku